MRIVKLSSVKQEPVYINRRLGVKMFVAMKLYDLDRITVNTPVGAKLPVSVDKNEGSMGYLLVFDTLDNLRIACGDVPYVQVEFDETGS